MMFRYDSTYLNECRKIYANSKVVADRLKRFNDIDADGVVYPPLIDVERFRCEEPEPYFLYASRLAPIKRQSLAVESMRYVKGSFKLVIAGKADTPSYLDELNRLVELYGLQNKVEIGGRWIDEREKADLFAKATGALYLPYDEDSYGYVTLEAFHASKPVISLTDSGGPEEVIENGVNGLIVEPTPQALADAMDRLWSNRKRTIEMGRAAFESLRKHRINWDNVVEAMVA
jgi:glycosyltransferase involved in cell wall biosynthesis